MWFFAFRAPTFFTVVPPYVFLPEHFSMGGHGPQGPHPYALVMLPILASSSITDPNGPLDFLSFFFHKFLTMQLFGRFLWWSRTKLEVIVPQ